MSGDHSWKQTQLGDVCEITSALVDPRERQYIDLFHVGGANIESDTGALVELKTAREEALISGKFAFDEGAVLYSKIRPYLRKVARPDFKGLCSADIYPLAPRNGCLDRNFLYYLLLTEDFTDFAVSGSARAGMPKVNRDHLFSYRFPLPPLPEQRRIVGILDEAFAAIATAKANAEKNLQNARDVFESELNALVTSDSVDSKLTTLGDEVDLFVGFAFKSKQYTVDPSGIRLLRGDNIVQGMLRWDDVKKWPASDIADYERYQLKEGDVVLAMDRPWVKAGLKHATITSDDLPCLLVQRTARLRPGRDLDGRYLMSLIGGVAFVQHILGVQGGIGVPHISGQQIKDFGFRKPPLREQRRRADVIVELRAQTSRLATLYHQKLAALDALKKSLLHQAFSGQLGRPSARLSDRMEGSSPPEVVREDD